MCCATHGSAHRRSNVRATLPLAGFYSATLAWFCSAVDSAGWHRSNPLVVPDNIVLLKLPPYAPELNPTENICQYLRANSLANSVWETYEAIVDACCNAWRGLIAKPEVITSIGNPPMGASQYLGRPVLDV